MYRKNTPAAKIFESMTSEDFKHSIVVTKTAKRLAWIAVIFINIYFVYFSVLRGITRSVDWQIDFLLACIFQLIVEIFVYETGECLWIHFTIPKLVSADVAATMSTVKHAIDLAFQSGKTPVALDSPKYFFVSRKLATAFPDLFESSVVLAFQSYFPPSDLDTTMTADPEEDRSSSSSSSRRGLFRGNEVRVWRVKKRSPLATFVHRFNVSVLVLAILQHLGTVPIRIQQVIIHTLQPILFSLIIILGIFFLKYPVFVLLPAGFIVYEVTMYAFRRKNRVVKVMPAINNAEKNSNSMEAFIADAKDLQSEHSRSASSFDEIRDFSSDEEAPSAAAGREFASKKKALAMEAGQGVVPDSSLCSPDIRDFIREMEKTEEEEGVSFAPSAKGGVMVVPSSSSSSESDASSSEDSSDEVVVVPPGVADKKLFLLERALDRADHRVKQFSVDIGLNEPQDFDFYWTEDSDEYRYYYQSIMTPFVNSQGEDVNLYQIISKRNVVMINDYKNYKICLDLAQAGLKRRKQFNQDWDSYRLHDSELVLPFIDQAGNKVTSNEILAVRDMYSKVTGSDAAVKDDKNEVPPALHALRQKKQVAEHKLMVYRDHLVEMQAGNLVLAKYRDRLEEHSSAPPPSQDSTMMSDRVISDVNKSTELQRQEDQVSSLLPSPHLLSRAEVGERIVAKAFSERTQQPSSHGYAGSMAGSVAGSERGAPHVVQESDAVKAGRAFIARMKSQQSGEVVAANTETDTCRDRGGDIYSLPSSASGQSVDSRSPEKVDYFTGGGGGQKPTSELDLRIQRRVNEAYVIFLQKKKKK
jgi:hypothetical protein